MTQVRDTRASVNTLVGVLILAFVALSVVCFHQVGPTGLDSFLLHGYRPNPASVLFRVAKVLTGFGSPGAVVVLACVAASLLWWRFRSTVWAVTSVLAPGLAGISEATLKVIIGRPRPVAAALTGEAGNGFPSGHTTGFAALAFIVVFALLDLWGRDAHRNRALLIAAGATAAMAVTRVLVGAHYPTDVIAGAILGYLVARAVSHVSSRPAEVQRITNRWHLMQSRTGRSQ